jgi:hypothetical protein
MPAMTCVKPTFYSNIFAQTYENKEKYFIASPEDYSLTKIRKFCDGERFCGILMAIGGVTALQRSRFVSFVSQENRVERRTQVSAWPISLLRVPPGRPHDPQ